MKDMAVGDADRAGESATEAVTTRVTDRVWVPEDETIEMVPVQVAAAVNEEGSTETVKLEFDGPAVKAPVGVRVSQVLVEQVCSDT